MAAVSLAMPTNLWDPAGRECGITFLYLHFFRMAWGQAKNPNHSNFMCTRSPQSGHIVGVMLLMVLDDDFVLFYDFGDYCHGIVRLPGVPRIGPLIHLGIFVFLTHLNATGLSS